jgi:phage virion morphogenesis protein
MARQFLNIKVFDTKFIKDLRKRAILWARPAKPLRIIGQYIAEISKQAFDKQQDPGSGASWQRLSPAYAAYKRKHGKSAKALIWHSKLKRSIGFSLSLGGRPSVLIGPADEKGPWHQFGTFGGSTTSSRSGGSVSRGGVPARPFLGLSLSHEKHVKDVIAKYLRGVK